MEYKQGIRLNNPQAVKRLLNRTINGLLADELGTDKSRCIGYLCSILLKAIEVEDISKRLDQLEDKIQAEGKL